MTRPRARVIVDAVSHESDRVTGRVRIEGIDSPVDVVRLDTHSYRVVLGGRQFEIALARGTDTDWGTVDGRTYRWLRDSGDQETADATPDAPIAAPMPATVTAVRVASGQVVTRGDTLVVLEAMKMEIPLTAPRDGRVTAVRCAEGDRVDPDMPLVELGPLEGD